MDISYKWLKRFIDVDMPAERLAAVLTSLGLECDTVEEVESIRGGLRGVVIGKVLTCVDHPDSDHLHITTVDLGGDAPEQIVCGAPNVAAGQYVVVATVGAVLYDGDKEVKIRKSKIRGVESSGMICAEDELGLGSSHDGIIVLPDPLPEGVRPGTPAAEYFHVESDWRLEVELTPNRVDAASHYGTARDLKAWMWRTLFEEKGGNASAGQPELRLPDDSSFAVDRPDGGVKVTVEDSAACPRYSGVTVRGVKVAESPEWLKELLVAAGQRPINNIVDITNFILLGLGQPLHCFDLDKIEGGEIVVRQCPGGTPFTTLDGEERTLDAADLMICDLHKPMAIAGVFGGLDSGVTESTTSIFIESAWFNPTSVRRTARRHGLSTDASFRYERGTDPQITVYAARVAALMVKELAGGEICGPVVDEYPEPVKPAQVDFSLDYCKRLVGKEIPRDLILTILKALEFDIRETEDPDRLLLTVPTYRVDVTRPCDVVEEILRVYGYNNVEIPAVMHATLSQRGSTDENYALRQLVSDMLTAAGFQEILNNSLTSRRYYEGNEVYPASNAVELLNPLSGDLALMRQTLLYGGLESIAHNVNRKETNLKFYEFGNVYRFDPNAEPSAEKPLTPYSEKMQLGIWLTGNYSEGGWNCCAAEGTVYDLKAVALAIFRRIGVDASALKMHQDSTPLFSARLVIESRSGVYLGHLGLVARNTLRLFDIEGQVAYCELDWTPVYKMAVRHVTEFAPLPKTQPVKRDLALLLDKSVAYSEVEETIRKAGGKLLCAVTLFDVYEGEHLPAGKKSYAVSMTLQDPDKTLNDKQIDAVMQKIVKSLEQRLGASLR